MKSVVLEKENRNQRPSSQDKESDPDTLESLHEARYNTVVPPLGKILEAVQIIPDPVDLLSRVWLLSECRPEARLKNALVDRRG